MIPAVDVCICTYRRTHIADTLRSIAAQTGGHLWQARVIVADNDHEPSARKLVEDTSLETGLLVTYIHAPAGNISVARNACLDAASASFLAFIDDDEIAAPGWLSALVTKLASSDADVVLGPVQAVYPARCARWLRKGDFHSTRPVWVNGEIITGYTCNVIFRRTASALLDRRFRVDLGQTGGEDTVFFSEVYNSGGKIDYAENALVTEPVAKNRANMSWLIHRKFRFGETHGILLTNSNKYRLKCACFASVKLMLCLAAGCIELPHWRFWLLRGMLHAGALSRLLHNHA